MKKFIIATLTKSATIILVCSWSSLVNAATILEEDCHRKDRRSYTRNYCGEIEFSSCGCTVIRTYDHNGAPKTKIYSKNTITQTTMRELAQIIISMDEITLSQKNGGHSHKSRLIHNLVDEGRVIVRECLDVLPRPIGYILSFWPIEPILNRLFPRCGA